MIAERSRAHGSQSDPWYDAVAVFRKAASRSEDDWVERGRVLTLIRARHVWVVLVTGLTRQGQSTMSCRSKRTELPR